MVNWATCLQLRRLERVATIFDHNRLDYNIYDISYIYIYIIYIYISLSLQVCACDRFKGVCSIYGVGHINSYSEVYVLALSKYVNINFQQIPAINMHGYQI